MINKIWLIRKTIACCVILTVLSFTAGSIIQANRITVQKKVQLIEEISQIQTQVNLMLIAAKAGNLDKPSTGMYALDIPSLRCSAGALQTDINRSQFLWPPEGSSIYYLLDLTEYLLSTDYSDFDELYKQTLPLLDLSIDANETLESLLQTLNQKITEKESKGYYFAGSDSICSYGMFYYKYVCRGYKCYR